MIKRILNKLRIPQKYKRKMNNREVIIPISHGIGLTNLHDAEPWMSHLLEKLGSAETRFLDVGINVGQTLLKWKTHFPTAPYVGFEPNKKCIEYLHSLIRLNHFENCKIHPYGLSTQANTGHLHLKGRDPADSSASIIDGFRENEDRRKVPVELVPLTAIDPQPFDLVKIDVEGAELEVIQTIFESTGRPIIICEILPIYHSKNHARLDRQIALEKCLKDQDYGLWRIRKTSPIQLEAIETIGIHDQIEDCDYVFMPTNAGDRINRNFKV